MIDFFLNVIIVSGGVACIIAWILFFIEVYDRITGKHDSSTIDLGGN